MKLLSKTDHQMVFELEPVETQIVLLLFSSDPVAFDPGKPLGNSPPAPKSSEPESSEPDLQFLKDALQETRDQNRLKVGQLLSQRLRKKPNTEQTLLSLPCEDVDWVLQVLNEIRVGSWYALNCPEEHEERQLSKDPEHLHHVLRLEFSGMLQAVILAAFEST